MQRKLLEPALKLITPPLAGGGEGAEESLITPTPTLPHQGGGYLINK